MASRPPLSRAARSNPGWIFTLTLESFGAISTSQFFEQIEAGARLDQILLLCVIHPIEISGEEDVRRRGARRRVQILRNLLDECAAGRIESDCNLSGLVVPLFSNLVERVLQACGREYENIVALR
jgi:hypothetical protein